ncbi:MAG: DUF2938 family protein [Gemmatimonadales bacterium]|nr:DUF2938 family protein [Gemmatimonadales bacterium]
MCIGARSWRAFKCRRPLYLTRPVGGRIRPPRGTSRARRPPTAGSLSPIADPSWPLARNARVHSASTSLRDDSGNARRLAGQIFGHTRRFGLGIAASRTPNPTQARLKSLVTHTVFGVGLYVCALGVSYLLRVHA